VALGPLGEALGTSLGDALSTPRLGDSTGSFTGRHWVQLGMHSGHRWELGPSAECTGSTTRDRLGSPVGLARTAAREALGITLEMHSDGAQGAGPALGAALGELGTSLGNSRPPPLATDSGTSWKLLGELGVVDGTPLSRSVMKLAPHWATGWAQRLEKA
jgi:hypothetical protein